MHSRTRSRDRPRRDVRAVKTLLVGGGGREHALAWRLVREDPSVELLAAPGNPGIGRLARCVPVRADDIAGLVGLAAGEKVDFVIVGPEQPLADGLVDALRARGIAAFGPTRAAAMLETSKTFAKQTMLEAGIPTATAQRHTDPVAAKRAAHAFGAPVVIKASGLAAGKGVMVCETLAQAERAIDFMLCDDGFGAAGAEILVEEFMEGEEASLFFLTDGTRAIALPPAQDHKRLLDGDHGPNTGGMGAYAPASPDASSGLHEAGDLVAETHARIVLPVLDAMRAQGSPFAGLLYVGVMVTASGPRVVEFNCRFGDPETQTIMPILEAPILPLIETVARGGSLPQGDASRVARSAVTIVVAAAGYPDAPRSGAPILLPSEHDDGLIFHAGTRLDDDGSLVTAGGRVVGVTGIGDDFERARARAVSLAEQVRFEGAQFRRDIGWRESERRARTS